MDSKKPDPKLTYFEELGAQHKESRPDNRRDYTRDEFWKVNSKISRQKRVFRKEVGNSVLIHLTRSKGKRNRIKDIHETQPTQDTRRNDEK